MLHGRRVYTEGKTYLINELHSLLTFDAPNGADFLVVEEDTIEFVSCYKHFRTESRRDELARRGEVVDHSCIMTCQRLQTIDGMERPTCNCSTVLRIQVGIDLYVRSTESRRVIGEGDVLRRRGRTAQGRIFEWQRLPNCEPRYNI